MARKLSNVVAVSEGDLNQQHFLGRLATYTLPDEPVNGAKLVRSWAKHGLDVDDLPEARQPVHVFQSACASVKTRRASNGHGERTEITADEVHNNGGSMGSCIYQITVKVWEAGKNTVEYEKALRVTFDKRDSSITFDDLGYQDVRLSEIEDAIQKHFDANAKTVPGQKVRNAIRAKLMNIGAQNIRRKAGGLYFVPAEYPANAKMLPTKPILDGLAAVLEELYRERGDFYMIPLVNDEGQRQMVRKHFVLNVNEKAEELAYKAIQRVRQGRGERGVRADLIANLHNERRRLAHAVTQFDNLVTLEQADVADKLSLLDDALEKLQDLADEKEAA